MDIFIVLLSLAFLIFIAYRGFSVILFAPVAAIGAVLLTSPTEAMPVYTNLFMLKASEFFKNFFPIFLLGAVFGKLIEVSGYSKSIVLAVMGWVGQKRAIPVIVFTCILLTYGGVSLFVVVFAVYPFAAEMFRLGNIPKRLIPGTIALGAFTVSMDALPGSPQIQNIIPTTFFGTTTWAAPRLALVTCAFILSLGLLWLEWRRRVAAAKGEGYGTNLRNEPVCLEDCKLPSVWLAITPLILVAGTNFVFTRMLPRWYGGEHVTELVGLKAPIITQISTVTGAWAVELALLIGILFVVATSFTRIKSAFNNATQSAVGGAILASCNTASEYGYGAVVASLPGFLFVSNALQSIGDPLMRAGITVTSLAGITGSGSGGLSIALGAMGDQLYQAVMAAGISPEVLHRICTLACGGMDTLPHNGAVITLLAVTGLTHKQAYGHIFAVTIIKTMGLIFAITFFKLTGIY